MQHMNKESLTPSTIKLEYLLTRVDGDAADME